MNRTAHKPRSLHQRHADMAGGEVEDRGQGALRDNHPRHHNVDLHAIDMLARVQGEPVAAVANALDVPEATHKNIWNLMGVDHRPRMQFDKHDALPSRAPMARGDVFPCNSAITSSLFLTEGRGFGYRAVKAIRRILLTATPSDILCLAFCAAVLVAWIGGAL